MIWAQSHPVANGVEAFPRTGGPAMGLAGLVIAALRVVNIRQAADQNGPE